MFTVDHSVGDLGALDGGVGNSVGLDGGACPHCCMALLAARITSKDAAVHGGQWLELLFPLNTRQ